MALERDPNLDHPAVKLYRATCRLTANHVQRREIVVTLEWGKQEVGSPKRALEIWQAVLEKYMLDGKNPKNVGYILDLYEERIRGPKWDRHNRNQPAVSSKQ